jgi:hypothetical protein
MKKEKRWLRKEKSKRAQLTVFIILALLIVGVIAFLFYPQIKKAIIPKTPSDLVPKECMEKAVKESLATIMLRGGSFKPELYFRYNDETIDYLCYTSEWYKTCVMQKPFLKQQIESEVNNQVQDKIKKCITGMENKLESKGYSIKKTGTGKANVLIRAPHEIQVNVDISMSLEKNEEKQTLKNSLFTTRFTSGAYEMIMIASSIQNFEARFGDSIPEDFMSFYPNLKVQKLKQSDGTKVYIITNRDTKEILQFATRSLAWPPGYALE